VSEQPGDVPEVKAAAAHPRGEGTLEIV